MACRSPGIYFNQNGILIAIQTDFHDLLRVSRRLSFVPELLAAAAPEIGFAAFEREPERFLIHVSHGQDFACARVLNDGGNQAVGPELCLFQNAIHRTTTPRSRRYDFACPIVTSRKWNMEAASTALAAPSLSPSYRCSRDPAPPDAMTGI